MFKPFFHVCPEKEREAERGKEKKRPFFRKLFKDNWTDPVSQNEIGLFRFTGIVYLLNGS